MASRAPANGDVKHSAHAVQAGDSSTVHLQQATTVVPLDDTSSEDDDSSVSFTGEQCTSVSSRNHTEASIVESLNETVSKWVDQLNGLTGKSRHSATRGSASPPLMPPPPDSAQYLPIDFETTSPYCKGGLPTAMDVPDEWITSMHQRIAAKYESFHCMVYYFIVVLIVIGYATLGAIFFAQSIDERFSNHRFFLACLVLPLYTLCSLAVILTRKHYMLNITAIIMMSAVLGYMLAFISFMMFSSFVSVIVAVQQ